MNGFLVTLHVIMSLLLIGCILLSDIDTSDNGGHVPATVGTIVTFDKDFETGEYNGTITFGHISVYTNYDGEDDE